MSKLQTKGILLLLLAAGWAGAQQTEVEPNGSRGQATEFALGTSIQGYVSGDDYDWYKVHIDQGGLLIWSVTNVDANLNVWLRPDVGDYRSWWDANRKGRGAAESSGVWLPAGDWWLVVHNAWDGSAGNYTVTASLQAVTDPYEPNNTFATATVLRSGVELRDPWIYYTGDEDFYRIDLTVASQLNVQISQMGDRVRWRYQLYDANQSLVHDSNWVYADYGDYSRDNWFDLANGTYYLKIFARTDHDYYDTLCHSTQPYRIRATVYPAQDPNEPNNTFATATSLISGEPITSVRLYLAGDVDYYKFTPTANSQVTVFLKNPPDHYYRYQIYNSAQNLIYDRGEFLGEVTETHHLAPDTYYLRVFADQWNDWRRWDAAPYTLQVTWTGYPDPNEPNNDPATATPLVLRKPLRTGNIYLLGDVDYFKFSVTTEGDFNISLYGVPWPLAPKFQLLDAAQRQIRYFDNGSGVDVAFSQRLGVGDFYIRIWRDDWDTWRRFSPNPYTLLVTDQALPKVDRLELTPLVAAVDPGYSLAFTAWPRGPGGVAVPFPGNVEWTVTPGTGNGTLALSGIYNTTATFTATQPGTVVLKATLGGKSAQATLTIPRATDPHEPNNSIAGSTPLTFGVPIADALLFGNDDVDYYELTVGGPGKIKADLTNVGLTLDAVLGLRSSTGADLGTVSARGTGGDESLLVQVTAAGNYYLVVYSAGNASRSVDPYRLSATFTPVSDLHEVNNSFDSGGTPVQLDVPIGDAYIFPAGDQDYYIFTVPGPGDITVRVTNVPASIDVQLNVANSSQQWLFGSDVNQGGYGESETATVYVDVSGTYWARVRAQSGDSGSSPYTLRVTHTALTAFDPYERNDSLAEAKFVASGSTIADSPIFRSGDVDYFKTSLAVAGSLSFLLSDLQPDMDGSLTVYDGNGSQIASADRFYAGQPEFITLANVDAGDYYVGVASSGYSRTPYKLGMNTPIGRLIGQVTRPRGNVLAGATVTASQGGQAKAYFTTGADGFYSLILEPGTYDVTASVIGFAEKTEVGVQVNGGVETTLNFEVTDSAPPTIGHVPVAQFKAGKDIPISATVTDNVGVAGVNLFYRRQGTGAYTRRALAKDDNEAIYRGTIPKAVVTTAGVEYYLDASDSVPNTARSPDTAPSTPYRVQVLTLEADFSDDGYVDYLDLFLFALHWHLGPTDPNWDPIYDLSPGPDPGLGQPTQYIDYADLNLFAAAWHTGYPPSRSRAGEEKAGVLLALDLDPAAPGIQNIQPAQAGDEWEVAVVALNAADLHGVNFDLTYDAATLELVAQDGKPAQEGDFLGTNRAGDPTAFLATRAAGRVNVSTSILGRAAGVEGQGVLATLRFRVREAASVIRLRLEEGRAADHQGRTRAVGQAYEALLVPNGELAPANGWAICLAAVAPSGADRWNFLGVEREAWQVMEPPAGPEGVALGLAPDRLEESLLRSVDLHRPAGGPQVWNVIVASRAGEEVTLTWGNLRQLPKDLTAALVDEATGQRIALRSRAAYTYRIPANGRRNGGLEVRRFRLEVAPRTGGGLAVMNLTVQPGRGNQAYRIGFTLTREARVRAEIATLSGRPVRELAAGRDLGRGLSELNWDGRDAQGVPLPNGLYLVRVTATDEEGNAVSAVRTVAVRR